jgi:hypothetical protein
MYSGSSFVFFFWLSRLVGVEVCCVLFVLFLVVGAGRELLRGGYSISSVFGKWTDFLLKLFSHVFRLEICFLIVLKLQTRPGEILSASEQEVYLHIGYALILCCLLQLQCPCYVQIWLPSKLIQGASCLL